MKKIILYIIALIGICFLIPIVFTTKFKTKEVFSEKTLLDIERYLYTDFQTIKLLHKKTNEIEEKNLDDYIAEVVSAEIPIDYDLEAIKAQAVAARTYTIYRIIHSSKHERCRYM